MPSVHVDTLLEEMAREGQGGAVAGKEAGASHSETFQPPNIYGPRGGTTRARPPAIRYTHQAMIDMIVENPAITQNEIAKQFGYTTGWVSTVFTSDAFKAQLEARREEIVDPILRMSLKERMEALTSQSLKILMEKMSKPADQVADGLVLKALELGAKAMGLGGTAPQQTVVVTSEQRLENLKGRLLALKGSAGHAGQAGIIDV